MAGGNWGKEFDSEKEAARSLCSDMGVSDAVLLEMLRRFDLVIKAVADDSDILKKDRQKPENAKVFPEAKVGDILYMCWEFNEGIERYVVVALAEDGFVRVVSADQNSYAYEVVSWGWNDMYVTEAEAVKALAINDNEYYTPRVNRSRAILKAVEAGDDLAFVRDGVQLTEESGGGV
jgi:hypothetical protein